MELMNCPSLAVPKEVMHHVVRVESSYNPFAIGVVGGRLARQPRSLPEALATVRMLEAKGYNFSLGLAQVNRYNLQKYGIESYETAFEICPNLQTGSRILAECHSRSGGDWGKSFSCYYSGNFVTGYRHRYVQKIYASMRGSRANSDVAVEGAIPVVGRASRRVVDVTRFPVHAAQAMPQRTPAMQTTSTLQTLVQARSSQPFAPIVAPAALAAPVQAQAQGAAIMVEAIPKNLSQTPPPATADAFAREGAPAADAAFVF